MHRARPLPRRGCEERLSKLYRRRGLEPVRPHDLREDVRDVVAKLGFGRQAVSRLLNHSSDRNSVTAIYDRHNYARENAIIYDAVAAHIDAVVNGTATDNVVVRLR